MTWTIHIAFSWSWWSFAAGIAVGSPIALLVFLYGIERAGGLWR